MNSHEQYARSAGYALVNPEAPNLWILLHGLGGDRHQPLRLSQSMGHPALAILAPDARGHGTTLVSGDERTFHFASMVADLLELMARTGQLGKPTHLTGISMGAAVALRLALRREIDVRGATFVRPAFTASCHPPNLAVLQQIGTLLEQRGAKRGLAAFDRSASFREIARVSPLNGESLRQQFTKPLAQERAGRLRHIPANIAFDPLLGTVDLRTSALIVGTDRDPVHPWSIAEEWASRIAGAGLVRVPPKDNDPDVHEWTTRTLVQTHMSTSLGLGDRQRDKPAS